jgi:hypothetical protein
LKLLQACDQWHSSLVSTFLTSSHCKLRPNTGDTITAGWMANHELCHTLLIEPKVLLRRVGMQHASSTLLPGI